MSYSGHGAITSSPESPLISRFLTSHFNAVMGKLMTLLSFKQVRHETERLCRCYRWLTVFPLTCLGSFVLQGSILTFDPAVKAEIARQRPCCRISGSISSHFWKRQRNVLQKGGKTYSLMCCISQYWFTVWNISASWKIPFLSSFSKVSYLYLFFLCTQITRHSGGRS